MENRSHALWAGLFTIALLCATIIAGIWINHDSTDFEEYEIITNSPVSGLNPQAAVRYRGLAVGHVTRIGFDPTVPGQILIRIAVNPATPVTHSTWATLSSQGVTGIAFVQLDDNGSNPARLTATSTTGSSALARIPLQPGVMENLEQRGNRLLANAEILTGRLSELMTPTNQKVIIGAFANVGHVTQHWTEVAGKADTTLESIRKLAEDSRQTSRQITQLVTGLQATSEPLNQAISSLEQVSTLGQETLPHIHTLSREASNSARTMNRTLEQVGDQPQSLLFGKPAPAPGPGETGFIAPTEQP